MTVSVVFAIAGVIALLFGIIGGGIKAKEVEVPLLSIRVRIFTIIVGLILISITIWLENQSKVPNSDALTQLTLTPLQPTVPQATLGTISPKNTNTPISISTAVPHKADLEAMYSELNKAKNWNLVLKDSFDKNDANWPLWNVNDNIKNETMIVGEGVLRWGMQLKIPDQAFYEIAPVFSYSDFYYSAKMKRIGGRTDENQAAWGILFRRSGKNYYSFRLNDLQEYSVQIHNQEGFATDLIGWTKSPFVETDEFNELTVIAEGSDLYFFINGTPVGTISDGTYSEGNIGFLAGVDYVLNDFTYFEIDDFELREKP